MSQIDVLDHGFVRLVDTMGDDAAIVQAARVSYGEGTKTVREDEGLIRYLMRHQHTTPFEMCEIKLHCKMPLFVARQWIRHRTANVNEYSARYSVVEEEFYVPEAEQLQTQSTSNKQGRDGVLRVDTADYVREAMRRRGQEEFHFYGRLISDEVGLARELARINLPVSTYTQWYWKCDLHNLFHFLKLRMDPHAQYEIRVYADAIASIVKEWVPLAYRAFEDYRLNAHTFSRQEMELLRSLITGPVEQPEGISLREWQEFQKALGLT